MPIETVFFNSSDLIQVFQRGEYEDGVAGNSVWENGDWNGDGDFNTGDLVLAFQHGSYSKALRPSDLGDFADHSQRRHVRHRSVDTLFAPGDPNVISTQELAGVLTGMAC